MNFFERFFILTTLAQIEANTRGYGGSSRRRRRSVDNRVIPATPPRALRPPPPEFPPNWHPASPQDVVRYSMPRRVAVQPAQDPPRAYWAVGVALTSFAAAALLMVFLAAHHGVTG